MYTADRNSAGIAMLILLPSLVVFAWLLDAC
jgi:hypothetical protein